MTKCSRNQAKSRGVYVHQLGGGCQSTVVLDMLEPGLFRSHWVYPAPLSVPIIDSISLTLRDRISPPICILQQAQPAKRGCYTIGDPLVTPWRFPTATHTQGSLSQPLFLALHLIALTNSLRSPPSTHPFPAPLLVPNPPPPAPTALTPQPSPTSPTTRAGRPATTEPDGITM